MKAIAPRRSVVGRRLNYASVSAVVLTLSCGHEVTEDIYTREADAKTKYCFACLRGECVKHTKLTDVPGRGEYCAACGWNKWILE